jgi:hypothetical protein
MSEETEPTLDTSSAASADESMEAIASAIETGMQVVGALIGDPCTQRTILFDRWQLAQRLNNTLITGATWWAGTNHTKVRQSMQNWGRATTGAAGAKHFGTYLINHYVLYPLPGPLIVGAYLVAGRGNERPSRSTAGLAIGPGIHIGPDFTLTGPRVVEAWDDWAHRMRTQWVYATSPARPLWRERLISWVGRSRDDWRIWVPGDPIAADSRIGRNLVMIENLKEQLRVVSADCVRGLDIAEQLAISSSETEQEMLAVDLEKSLAGETTERTQVVTLALAAFGATWLLTRGRR